MSFASSLQSTARTLIDTFGTSCTIYSYSSSTKSENDEGDINVTNWGTGTSVSAVIGDELTALTQVDVKGNITDETAEIIIKDNVTVGINDKVNLNSKDYRVDSIDTSNRVTGILIVKRLTMSVR